MDRKSKMQTIQSRRPVGAGFTLVEIMIVVAIIGLLATLATPGFIKVRKQSQGRRILNDVRQMDAAINQWALEYGKMDGATISVAQASTFLKGAWLSKDPLGNDYLIGVLGPSQIMISAATKVALDGAGVDWGAF